MQLLNRRCWARSMMEDIAKVTYVLPGVVNGIFMLCLLPMAIQNLVISRCPCREGLWGGDNLG